MENNYLTADRARELCFITDTPEHLVEDICINIANIAPKGRRSINVQTSRWRSETRNEVFEVLRSLGYVCEYNFENYTLNITW